MHEERHLFVPRMEKGFRRYTRYVSCGSLGGKMGKERHTFSDKKCQLQLLKWTAENGDVEYSVRLLLGSCLINCNRGCDTS